MTKLIGVTGLARAGKDTFAQECVKRGYKRLAFADALKTTVAHIANEPSHLYFDDVTKEEYTPSLDMTRRRALQEVGNGIRESLGTMTWIRRVLRQWEADGRPPTVISDVRYPNEAHAIHELGGIVVRVNRRGAGLSGDAAKHVSEAGVPENLLDFDLDNNGTVSELGVEVAKILSALDRGIV